LFQAEGREKHPIGAGKLLGGATAQLGLLDNEPRPFSRQILSEPRGELKRRPRMSHGQFKPRQGSLAHKPVVVVR
jgi:hypothetical protein